MTELSPKNVGESGRFASGGFFAALREAGSLLAADRDRWVLWLPVLLGMGIGAYFSLGAEPPFWLGGAGVLLAAAAGALLKGRPDPHLLAVALGTVALGFAAAQWRAVSVAAPMLEARLGPTQVTGRLVSLETRENGLRAVLERLQVAGLGPERTPDQVRLVLRGEQPDLAPGDWLRVKAILSPPRGPTAPGAFDFQRHAFFRGLGGMGFSIGKVEVVATREARPAGLDAFWTGLADLRHRITTRVLAALPGPEGTIAAALMAGEQGAVPKDLMAALRDAGVVHLLSISGLHIGLVAGILLTAIRAGLALVPALALRYPIKKWAAVVAIIGTLFYSLLAGASPPTMRSFLMISLVLLGVMVDRRALSMRTVAWAAAVLLLFRPEFLLDPGFQMSFAAVTGLVAFYEWISGRRLAKGMEAPSRFRQFLFYGGGILLTTVIASLASTPFAVYHFNRFALYGMAANLVAIPVTSVWVMPWAVVAFLLMPFGLEGFALAPLGWGIEVIIRAAETAAGWPGAATVLPAMPVAALATMTLGGLWLCLWRRPARLGGLAIVALGVGLAFLPRPPDLLVDGQGKLLAVRTAEGGLAVSSLSAGRFEREAWLQRAGLETAEGWEEAEAEADESGRRLRCDSQGCILKVDGRTIALVKEPGALPEDCRVADAVVSLVPVRRPCQGPQKVVDRFDLWKEGAHALWVEKNGKIHVESANGARGDRPWVIRPKARRDGGY